MIKMIGTDIDGTILPWDGSFTSEVKNCIKKLQNAGVKVVIVTGRMHSSAVHIAKELDLDTPIISYQGGLIKEINGNTIYQQEMAINYAKEIIDWARKNNIHMNLYLDDKLYVEKEDYEVKKYVEGKYINYTVKNFDSLKIENINKLLAIDYNDAERVTKWVEYLQKKYPDLYVVKSTPYFCEISSKNARKSLGVEYLRNLWGLKKEEVLTIGDQNNDIDLVECGGVGVAMGNGTEELKACADYVTDTVENNGFVKAVEKFIPGISLIN